MKKMIDFTNKEIFKLKRELILEIKKSLYLKNPNIAKLPTTETINTILAYLC